LIDIGKTLPKIFNGYAQTPQIFFKRLVALPAHFLQSQAQVPFNEKSPTSSQTRAEFRLSKLNGAHFPFYFADFHQLFRGLAGKEVGHRFYTPDGSKIG
jgi:hypothetical protein